jgi:hypothetical protein
MEKCTLLQLELRRKRKESVNCILEKKGGRNLVKSMIKKNEKGICVKIFLRRKREE